jgi:hypothetical protein
MRTLRAVNTVACALTITLATSLAFAQQPPDVAGAETLFEQGRQLLAEGRYKEACPKFAESQRLAPAAGTALNLASCYDKQGLSASAWGMYREAISLSVASAQTVREQFARDRAAELEPKLIKLVVAVSSQEAGLELRRDGIAMTHAQWGTPIPIDPGEHTVEASAPGKKKWSKTIQANAEGQTMTLTVPGLEDAPAEAPASPVIPRERPPEDTGGTWRIVGFSGIAVGAGLLGAGTFFALSSQSKKDDIEAGSNEGRQWDRGRQAAYEDGESQATLANVFFVSGAVVLATGVVLTVFGYTKKNDTGKATPKGAPSFASGVFGPRGGSLAWTF